MSRTLLFMAFCFLPTLAIGAETGAIGRLFHSPEERRVLDQLRHGEGGNNEAPEHAIAAQQITLNGIVRRNNGKSTTWLNGVPQTVHESGQGVVVLEQPVRHGSAALQLSSGKSVNLKTGQIYDIESGRVQEGFGMPPTHTHVIPSLRNKAEQIRATTRPAGSEGKSREQGK